MSYVMCLYNGAPLKEKTGPVGVNELSSLMNKTHLQG